VFAGVSRFGVAPLSARRSALLLRTGSFVVVAAGVLVLVGWALDLRVLKSLFPGLVTMKPNAAACFVLLGAALIVLSRERTGWERNARRALATVVAVIGALTVAEYVFGIDLRIDQLLFTEPGLASPQPPGRMAFATAASLVLLGGAIASRGALPSRRVRRTDGIVLVVVGVSFLAFVGYLYGVSELYGLAANSQMALHTSITLLIASFVTLGIDAEDGVLGVTLRPTAGGIAARRLFPLVVLEPVVTGALRLAGQHAGWFGTEFGLALMVASQVTVFVAAVTWLAWSLDAAQAKWEVAERTARTDPLTGLANRRAVEAALHQLDGMARRTGRSYSVIALDVDGLKQINDTRGHAAGDMALRDIADALRDVLRETDVAARVGGDEFLVILPDTDAVRGQKILERLRAAIASKQGVGASLGLATVGADRDGASVVAAADRAVYAVKPRRPPA